MRRVLACAVGVLAVVSQVGASPAGRRAAKPAYVSHPDRALAVKAAFRRSWDGYKSYAFPHDSLHPKSNTYEDDRNGWGASAVDAFSTALVMGDLEVIHTLIDFAATINFDKAIGDISLFETTIRYLGGLLSAYDLLKGPLKQHAKSDASTQKILDQAEHLAQNLQVAFGTPTGIPDNDLLATTPYTRNGSTSNSIATIGTLVLEWTRLSDLTGKPIYGQLAQKGESYLLNPKPPSGEPFPGLIGTNVAISTGLFQDSYGGWVGGDDSFYEYLIKMYLYDPKRFATYKDRWVLAVESSMKYLTSHPSSRPDLTYLAMFNNQTLLLLSQHLACFDGGNFILGGLTLNEPRYISFGIELTASCHDTYTSTLTGIGPETFKWQDGRLPANSSNNKPPPNDQSSFYKSAGFWIDNANYVLRPEVIESYYYAYRATGDTKYQEWAWDAFLAINRTCSVGSGYSSVNDVNSPGGGGFQDFQESFWFAEVLKYSYLIQTDDADYQVQADHSNKFVFNTECHPVAIPGGEQTR